MSNIVISVEHLSKRYDLGVIGTGTVSRDLNRWWAKIRHRPDPYAKIGEVDHGNREGQSILALNNVSFTVSQGEVLGIIGRNGAGKSTLLKILSQVTAPSSGNVKIKGRIGSLLEVGTGFHPELTGKENIYLNGAILGMNRSEVSKKFDEIVDFSGIEKFVDTPVKRYSSGMYVRLAFAVAAHLEPEILIVDEVLAVGDAEFQKKCLGKMSDVAKGGRTVLFVSHNLAAVQNLCPRSLLISKGSIQLDDITNIVINEYASNKVTTNKFIDEKIVTRAGSGNVRISEVMFGTGDFHDCGYWVSGEDAVIKIQYFGKNNESFKNLEFAIGIRDLNRNRLTYLGTKITHEDRMIFNGTGSSVCRISKLPFQSGRYELTLEIKENGSISDLVEMEVYIDVIQGDFYGTGAYWPHGSFLCDYSWKHE